MVFKKNLAIAVMNSEKIDKFDKILSEYASSTQKSSSHIIFDAKPLNPEEITHDITFFQIEAENESLLDEKLNELVEKMDNLNSDYTLRDDKTGEMIKSLDFVGMIKINFDDMIIIKEGTYKKIDELKQLKTEFGYCKGYKPDFRPIEPKLLKDMPIQSEKIYLFSDSKENFEKLKEYISEKITGIDCDLKIKFISFT